MIRLSRACARATEWPTNSCGKYSRRKADAARLITGAKRREHVTPILRQLHWLPVRRRVEFKMTSLVYQVLSSKVPGYLADDIHLASESSARSLGPVRGGSALSLVFTVVLVTDVLLQLDHVSGTTCQSAIKGSQLHRIQKTTENIHVSDRLRRIVIFLIIAPYKYSYLLTYLLTYGSSRVNWIPNTLHARTVAVLSNHMTCHCNLWKPWFLFSEKALCCFLEYRSLLIYHPAHQHRHVIMHYIFSKSL